MRSLRKFLGASSAERALAVRAFMALTAAGSLVKLRPYAKLRVRLQTVPAPRVSDQRRPSRERVLAVLSAVARRLPWATCLIQAIAAQDLLAENGHAADLRIGVTKEANGAFSAHAWLESDGKVLIGGESSPSDFALLDVSKARASHFAGER